MDLNIVFMGSPEFAAPSLKALASEFNITGVVTQPDRPKGRGRKLASPPVKELAQSMGFEVIQPQSLKETAAMEKLSEWKPDVIVVAAFGQLLGQNILDLAPLGCINVHPSLLPRWRGASPIQAAILNGDQVTGVTIMKLVRELDAGPIFKQIKVDIEATDTGRGLDTKLAEISAGLLVDVIKEYHAGIISPQAQDEELVTFAPRIDKKDGELDFSREVAYLERKIRAYNPVPGAFMRWNKDEYLKIHKAHITADKMGARPATRTAIDGMPAVKALDGWLVLDEVQMAGKKNMTGDVFFRGARNWMNTMMS